MPTFITFLYLSDPTIKNLPSSSFSYLRKTEMGTEDIFALPNSELVLKRYREAVCYYHVKYKL